MGFLPADYKAPASTSKFMKFQEGENRFRVMSPAAVGWEGWKDGIPFRRQGAEQNITAEEVDTDSKYGKAKPKINHFWAFLVYDYASKGIKLLTITQATVMKAIGDLVDDADWGDPVGYDLSVAKTKKGERTTYSVKAYPHKVLAPEITAALAANDIKVDDIFDSKAGTKDDIGF